MSGLWACLSAKHVIMLVYLCCFGTNAMLSSCELPVSTLSKVATGICAHNMYKFGSHIFCSRTKEQLCAVVSQLSVGMGQIHRWWESLLGKFQRPPHARWGVSMCTYSVCLEGIQTLLKFLLWVSPQWAHQHSYKFKFEFLKSNMIVTVRCDSWKFKWLLILGMIFCSWLIYGIDVNCFFDFPPLPVLFVVKK